MAYCTPDGGGRPGAAGAGRSAQGAALVRGGENAVGRRQHGRYCLARGAVGFFAIFAAAGLVRKPGRPLRTDTRAALSYTEMREAFGWDVERFVYFGGYPGAAALVEDEFRWRGYVLDAIVEPTLSRDVLQLTRIDKPALLRRLFVLGCMYSGQVLSYQKMIGQLQDVGNTTTLAHYLQLLGGAWMLTGLDKYAGDVARSRAASPKLQALNTALVSAQMGGDFTATRKDGELWGRLVESAVGAHLLNTAPSGMEVTYWRERNQEVDFVLRQGGKVVPIEVKSGRNKGALSGLKIFSESFKTAPGVRVGTGGVPFDVFFATPPEAWLQELSP